MKNLTGRRFGKLTALRPTTDRSSGCVVWKCLCDCGNYHKVASGHLRDVGGVRSCGCLRAETAKRSPITHGHTCGRVFSPTYRTWRAMLNRCFLVGQSRFRDYGGRGITVCTRWEKSFETFLQDMGQKPKGLTLERIDNNGDYEPGNCRWAKPHEQARNRRSNRVLGYLGKEMCQTDWAEFMNVNPATLADYLKRHNIKEAYAHYVGPVCFLPG